MRGNVHSVARRSSICGIALLGLSAPVIAATVQNFDTPGTAYVLSQHAASPPPTVIAGGPTGSFLRVATTATIPQNNSIAFDRSDPGAFCVVVAEFDFRLTPSFGRADGLGFALLNTAAYGRSGGVPPEAPLYVAEEPNFSRSLGVGFDLYTSPGEINNNHVSIHWNGALLTEVDAGSVDLGSGSFIHARIELDASVSPAFVSVTLTPAGGSAVELIHNYPVSGLRPYESRAYFAGRSGGQSADHDLDNVAVTFTGCPSLLGQWSSVQSWPSVPIHAHLLPDGKVMFWDRHDYGPPGNGMPRLWDPATGTFSDLAEPGEDYDIFCSGHSFLADGRLLVTGGHLLDNVGLVNASTYNPFANTWTRLPDMNAGRWYPTNTTLANGDVLTVSGTIQPNNVNSLPQVFQTASSTWRDLTGAMRTLPLYPFMYQAPNGKVFNAGPDQETRYLDIAGSGLWSVVGNSLYGYRDYGSSVLYADGKVLIAGGSSATDAIAPTATAEVIDLAAPSPAWRGVSAMAYGRRQHNLTLLADGTVLATGGSSLAGFNNSLGAVLAAELWDPATESWRVLAGMQVPRLYHSTALLLPDGRVLSAGGGHPSDSGNGDPDHPDAEIYSPPYLFKGARPVITSSPSTVAYGQSFFVGTPDGASITGVTWIRLSSVTHAFNQNQRICRPSFSQTASGLSVAAPADPNLCPPGHYLLFLLNAAGVPSVARTIRIDPALVAGSLGFYTVTPCRIVDTRAAAGPRGGPALQASSERTFPLTGACGVPASARALAVNVTVVQPTDFGDLRLAPGDKPVPLASSINFGPGQTRANHALVALAGGGAGTLKVRCDSQGTVHLLLDVTGYFQ